MTGWRRFWRALGARPWFTPVARAVVPADRLVSRLTGGRVVSLGMAPSLVLTTVGRRTGRPRPVVLQHVRDGAAWVVVGSNWGGPGHPAWVLNLLHRPAAEVTVGGRTVPVVAAEATGTDRDALWERFVRQWPGYRRYSTTAGDRRIRVFRLTPS
jgi:deazaflavin-dependent oxidoreductase (nitroreductase family)